jgi:hypothetical protein
MKEPTPSNERTLKRIAGVIHARRKGDITTDRAFSDIERIIREEQVAVARRKQA